MTEDSPAVRACLAEWKRGYRPSEWSQRYFRREFRDALEGALARLIARTEAGDELQAVEIARAFTAHVERLDAQLRQHLAGDRHPDGGSEPVALGRKPF